MRWGKGAAGEERLPRDGGGDGAPGQVTATASASCHPRRRLAGIQHRSAAPSIPENRLVGDLTHGVSRFPRSAFPGKKKKKKKEIFAPKTCSKRTDEFFSSGVFLVPWLRRSAGQVEQFGLSPPHAESETLWRSRAVSYSRE